MLDDLVAYFEFVEFFFITLQGFGPRLDKFPAFGMQLFIQVLLQLRQFFLRGCRQVTCRTQYAIQLVEFGGNDRLLGRPLIVFRVALGDLGQVAYPFGRNDIGGTACIPCVCVMLDLAVEFHAAFYRYFFHQPFEEFIHAGIVELGGNGSDDRQFFILGRPQSMVAFELLTHIVQGIQCAGFIELVHTNHVGIIEHIDLLQL